MHKFLGTRYPYPLNLHATLVLSLINILSSRDFLSPSINLILISESSAVSGLLKQPSKPTIAASIVRSKLDYCNSSLLQSS